MKIAVIDSGLGLVNLTKRVREEQIKHDFHLIFTSIFPLGQYSAEDIEREARKLEERLAEDHYDLAVVMCNTLSCFIKNDQKIIKILEFNRQYLTDHPRTLAVGTKHTIKSLNGGYIEEHLAADIESDDLEKIVQDIAQWPPAKSYLLCCTHYALVQDLASQIKRPSEVVDLTDKIVNLLKVLPPEEKLTIDYGGREKQIKKYLQF